MRRSSTFGHASRERPTTVHQPGNMPNKDIHAAYQESISERDCEGDAAIGALEVAQPLPKPPPQLLLGDLKW